MFSFENELAEDERILYQGRPVPGTGSKDVRADLFLIGFSLFVHTLLVCSVVFKIGDGADGVGISFIVFFAVTLLFGVIGVYDMMYRLFFKKYAVADDYYCITNQRILVYEEKKGELKYGFVNELTEIDVTNTAGGYGDVVFTVKASDDEEEQKELLKELAHQDPCHRLAVKFESVRSPKKIAAIAKNASR